MKAWLTAAGIPANFAFVIEVFIVVLAVVIINAVIRIFLNRLQKQLEKTRNPWDDALVDALGKPLSWLIWIVGITLAVEVLQESASLDGTAIAPIFEKVQPIREIALVVVFGWFMIRLIKRVEANIVKERERQGKPIDRSTVDAISKLVRLAVSITTVLVALQTLGMDISGILAFGGIGGIAVGFAAKDLLANFFGGLMIYLDRPFSIGDWVRSPDRDIEGTVEDIGWRLTRIRTFDKRPLYVPNSVFANISLENPSRMTNRRIKETIGIRYDDASKMDVIVTDVKQMLNEHPDIDTSQTLIVNFNAFAPCSLDFFIYTFTKTTNWIEYHKIKQDVMLKIIDIIDRHGAECAFPTSTIHIPEAVHVDSTLTGAK